MSRQRPLVGTGVSHPGIPRPLKPYVYRGTGEDIYRGVPAEPPEVTAARERHRAADAEIARRSAALEQAHAALDAMQAGREEVAPDGPDPEWYREMAAEDADELAGLDPVPAAAAVPVRVPAPAYALALAPVDELAELEAERGRYQAAMAAVPGPPAAPPPVTAAPVRPTRRHRPCGYLRGSRGCKAVCGDT